MLKLEGTVLKIEQFKSKKGKEMVSLDVYSDRLYPVLAMADKFLNIEVGEKVQIAVSPPNVVNGSFFGNELI